MNNKWEVLKKAVDNILFYSLSKGLNNANNILLSQTGDSDADSIGVHETIEEQRLSKDLLKGEVTQSVKEMRHRLYNVSKESNNYKYLGNGVAVKKNVFKQIPVEQSDGNEIWIIQNNEPIVSNVLDELERIGRTGDYVKYIINIDRDYLSRFRLEEYTTKLVVKKINETNVILDFYCSIYPNKFDIKSKPFIVELKKIKDNKIKSDITDISLVWFISQKAYGTDDLIKYSFREIIFEQILEFDGNYVLRFSGVINEKCEDLTKQYYNKIMDDKYKTNEIKNVDLSLNGSTIGNVKIVNNENDIKKCGICGQIINGYDANITKYDFGISLCSNCLKKKLENT